MKRFIVFLLVLGLAAGMAFAQDAPKINFSGGVDAGITFRFWDTGDWADDYEAYMNTWHDDAALRAELKGSFSTDYYGFEFGFRSKFSPWSYAEGGEYEKNEDGTLKEDDSGNLILKFNKAGGDYRAELLDTKGWIKPLQSNLLQITVGQTGGNWGTGGRVDMGTRDAGAQFNFNPMDGLNLGFTLGDRNFSAPDRNVTAETYFKKTAFGVKYSVDAFEVAANFQLNPDDKGDDLKAGAGVVVKNIGVPGLKFNAGVGAFRLGDFDNGKIKIGAGVEFAAGAFSINAGFRGFMYQNDADLGWQIEAEPSYQIIPDKLKGILYFGIHNDWENGGLAVKDEMVMELSPRIEWTIVKIGNAKIDSFYDFSYQSNGYKDPGTRTLFAAGVKFNWGF